MKIYLKVGVDSIQAFHKPKECKTMADLTLNEYTGQSNEEIRVRLNQEYNIIHSMDSDQDFITPVVSSGHAWVKTTISRVNQLFSRQFITLFSKKRFASEKQPLIIR